MNTNNDYFNKLEELIGVFNMNTIDFDTLNNNADRALIAIKELYMIIYENVARANNADYEHVVDYIKANEIINKSIYYVNVIYDIYCCAFTKIQDSTYKSYLNLVKQEKFTEEDTKEFHDNIRKFDKYANQFVKPISSYKIKIDEELRKRRRPLY